MADDNDCLPELPSGSARHVPGIGPEAANRGARETITSSKPQTILDFSGPLQVCSVALVTEVQPQEQDNANARPVAVVEWGNGGSNHSVEVDFQNGTVVRLVADWVRVEGRFLDPVDAATWPDFRGSAFVLPGYHPGLAPTFTSKRETVDATAEVFVPVPRWAKFMMLHHTQDTTPFAAAFTIEVLAGDADATVLSIVPGNSLTLVTGAVLPNGARALRISVTGVATRGFMIQFTLGL